MVQSLHHRVNTLPPAETVNLEPISQSLENLVQQFNNRPELQQLHDFQEAISSLPDALELENAIAAQIQESIQSLAVDINRQLAAIKPYKYQLVIDRRESRKLLMKALAFANERLILVCPWPHIYGVDSEVIRKLEELIKRKVHILD